MIPPEADAILSGDDQPLVRVRNATFVGVSGKAARVDMGDSRFLCDFGSGYIPVTGEVVRIWSVGDQHFLFPAGPRPTVGTVITASTTTAVVQTSVGEFTMLYFGAAPTSGDRVGVTWSEDGPWCTSRLSSTPPPVIPPPDPGTGGGGPTLRSATFQVTDTGSTDRGSPRWWQAQPWASNSTFGAWFYGNQIRDSIPAAAEFVSLEFYVSWQQRQGAAPRFALHDSGAKGLIPGFGAVTAWNPEGGWQVPPDPAGWFNQLKAGGSRVGVGLNQGGYNKFSSRAQDSMTGALRISWKA